MAAVDWAKIACSIVTSKCGEQSGTGSEMELADGYEVLRVHAAAGLALVRGHNNAATRWVPWPVPQLTGSETRANTKWERDDDGSIGLEQAVPMDQVPAPSLDLKREHFASQIEFEVLASPDGLPPQNLVVFLHGRGDSHRPFARLGAQMELPQTAVIALRAPLELPFGMGHTWMADLDDNYHAIPATESNSQRSRSLQAARDYVCSFLETLRDQYRWPLHRVFLFAFSQGASVAFHVATTAHYRLGGVVLVAGGILHGPHTYDKYPKHEHETPGILVCGSHDEIFPLKLAEESVRHYSKFFTNPTLLALHVVRNKVHDMIRSREEMQAVMAFFSSHLYLRDVALEGRSDIIEITAKR